jgi:hypothetical protein
MALGLTHDDPLPDVSRKTLLVASTWATSERYADISIVTAGP